MEQENGNEVVVSVRDLLMIHANQRILNQTNMTVNSGDYYTIYSGPRSGKTALLNCILSLFTYDKGDILLFGKHLSEDPITIKRQIGIALEKPAVFRDLSVRENVSYFAEMYMERKDVIWYVDWAIAWMGLRKCRHKYPKKLTIGELRRLDIACAAVHNPSLLVIDEPVHDLDTDSRNIIMHGLRELNEDGKTILTTSTDAEYVSDPNRIIGLFDHGKIIAEGTLESLRGLISLKEILVIKNLVINKEQEQELRKRMGIGELIFSGQQMLVRSRKGKNQTRAVIDYLDEQGISHGKVEVKKPSISDIFYEITGHWIE